MDKERSNQRTVPGLREGQFGVFIINPHGQILLFSGTPFLIEKSREEEAIKIFDAYEEAVDFAQKLILPATAKTYCICDHNRRCIKSGTGDEEREYRVITRK